MLRKHAVGLKVLAVVGFPCIMGLVMGSLSGGGYVSGLTGGIAFGVAVVGSWAIWIVSDVLQFMQDRDSSQGMRRGP